MTRPGLAATLALVAIASPAFAPARDAVPGGGTLAALADGAAARFGPPEAGRRGLALALAAVPPALGPPLAAALATALGRAGWAVSPAPADPDPEGPARAAGADWLLRLTAGASPDGQALVLVGQAIPLWPSFFLQARPGVRSTPPRLVSAQAPADAAARLLLGAAPPPAPVFVLRELVRLPVTVVALAAGEVDGLGPVLLTVAAEPAGGAVVRLLDRRGGELAARPLDPAGWPPMRLLAATAVVAPLGGGPFGVAVAGAAGGEALVRRGARLDRVAALPMAPLAAGEAGVLFGAFAAGKPALQDLVTVGVDASARPRSRGDLVGAAAAPRGSAPAFAVLHPGGRLELLDGTLAPAGEVMDVGGGFALADLDGDGRTEVVASGTGTGGPDRVRVIRSTSTSPSTSTVLWESPPIPGAILAAATADLTGDGLDDVVLAALDHCAGAPGVDDRCTTTLWLLTLDAREAR